MMSIPFTELPPRQLDIFGREVEVQVGPDASSRMLRRPHAGATDQATFARALDVALDRAGVLPGEAFYVRRVPPLDTTLPLARTTDPDTSKDAALHVTVKNQRGRALMWLARAQAGLTADDLWTQHRIRWQRMSDLVRLGLAVPTERREMTSAGRWAVVHVATDAGRSVAAGLEEAGQARDDWEAGQDDLDHREHILGSEGADE